MFNPNSINNPKDDHKESIEDIPSAENTNEAPETTSLNQKLGDIANSRVLNEELLHEGVSGNLIKADGEKSQELNLKNLEEYLTDNSIDPSSAESLLASGAFDVFGPSTAYKLSLWNRKNENGESYLTSSTRDTFGQSDPSGHTYKVFERSGFFVVYDSTAEEKTRHYVMDDPFADESPSKYIISHDQATFIDPETSKIVALGRYTSDKLADGPAKGSVMSVNNENLDDDLKKFDFKIVDQEKFDKLNIQ